ncbi:response regulator transcription factor [Actomonas aquatica]|uniref:Response regulator transcription factor n=1 Tax=Actomonas aquatica TaxID=2866162 RepID=A0ABZ1C496_9BACT|nr:response regulator transcription factor [Opitutus sp. WL0086]WRQ86222.1 response regulator transcription factor [Opitutus sp. WL0086]
MRVLVAEDEPKVASHLQQGLAEAGYAVDVAADGAEALWLATTHPYDAMVCDVMMPALDGVSVVRQLRRRQLTFPVIMLTARHGLEDRVAGLDAGADDYLAKPFSMIELLARLRAVLRRQRPEANDRMRVADLELDLIAHTVRRGDQTLSLTNREFALLELLMTASPKPVSKTAIIEHVWDQHFDSGTNVVNVYINYLRTKVDRDGLPPLIHTVRGVGFALRPPPATD